MIKKSTSTFIFSDYTWSADEGKATFTYKIYYKEETFTFQEVVTFPRKAEEIPQELLEKLLGNLSLVLGVSYYKLFCPKKIVLENLQLSQDQAEFWNTVYTKGLGEFFYRNQIDFRGLINFPFSEGITSSPVAFTRQERSLIGIGGGKDSIVTAELLKARQKPFGMFVLNSHPLQEEIAQLVGGEVLKVNRQLDHQLFELNKRSDVYNGHVPISAVYAFIGLFLAILTDYRYVIVSNEQSSNYGNVLYHDMEINHQWSKSFEFESMLATYIKDFITPDVVYFSLLRGLSELAIVERFTSYKKYFPHFSSCNKNFRITQVRSEKRWCGECAKCAFAFALLAAFLPKEEVVQIFGDNLFAKETLLQTYKELLGVANIKPFDCVGTPDEVRVAFYLASQQNEYTEDIAMKFFIEEVLVKIKDIAHLKESVLQKSSDDRIPKEFQERLY